MTVDKSLSGIPTVTVNSATKTARIRRQRSSKVLVIFSERVKLPTGLITWESVELDRVARVKDAGLDFRIGLLQLTDQLLGLAAPGRGLGIVPGSRLSETAGTLNKLEVIVSCPCNDVGFIDSIHRPDELHALEVQAVDFGDNSFQLAAVHHSHDDRLYDVAHMVAERDLVASELFGLRVEMAPAHAGAEVAGRLGLLVRDIKDICLENLDRDLKESGVALNFFAVYRIVARIHDQINEVERDSGVFMELLHELGHKHAVLSARDAHRDLVAGGDQLIFYDRCHERCPEFFSIFFIDAALDHLAAGELSCHRTPSN